MFDTPKAFASLSSGLLARKGAAKPAMRPQGFGQMGASLEDLGWNDMGFEAPKPTVSAQERDADHDAFGDSFAEQPLRNPVSALTPSPYSPAANPPVVGGLTPSPVHEQQAELEQRFGVPDEANDEGEEEILDEDEMEETFPLPTAPLVLGRSAFGLPPAAPAVAVEPPVAIEPDVASEPEQAPIVAQALAEPAPMPEPALMPDPMPVRAVRAAPGSGPKAAFTLRLDAARHLRLRLACALTGRSAQMLVTDAVDKLLADYPELENFAGTLPEGSRNRRAKG